MSGTHLTVGRVEFGPATAPLPQRDTMAALKLMKAGPSLVEAGEKSLSDLEAILAGMEREGQPNTVWRIRNAMAPLVKALNDSRSAS